MRIKRQVPTILINDVEYECEIIYKYPVITNFKTTYVHFTYDLDNLASALLKGLLHLSSNFGGGGNFQIAALLLVDWSSLTALRPVTLTVAQLT